MRKYILLTCVLTILSLCENYKNKNTNESRPSATVGDLLYEYNQRIIKAAKTKSFDKISDLYDNESFLMAEYNPLIQAKNNIKLYYDTIFARENIKEYSRQTVDIVEFTERIIEIGLFTKILENSEKFSGKYFNVWKIDHEGQLKFRAESFGYLHQVDKPSILVVPEANKIKREFIGIPLELDAYNALNETNVIDRIPERLANIYAKDAMYLPFADTIKTGRSDLLKHYTAYYQNPAKIDSIEVQTYAYDQVENGFIRYAGFYVDLSVPGFSGNTIGT